DPLGRAIRRLEYNDEGRLIRAFDAEGREISYDHDPDTRQEVVTDDRGAVTVIEYDNAGNVVAVTNPVGATIKSNYDSQSNLIALTDGRGNTTRFTYDAEGNQTSQTTATGSQTSITYQDGRVRSVIMPSGSALRLQYDDSGNGIRRIEPDGSVSLQRTYDDRGLLLLEVDELGNETSFEYDERGFQTAFVDPQGSRTELELDASGQPIARIESSGIRYEFERDSVQRTRSVAVDGQTLFVHSYNEAGDLVSTVDAIGDVSRYEVDSNGNELRFEPSVGLVDESRYDTAGNLVLHLDPLGNQTVYEYNLANELSLIVLPSGLEVRPQYDLAGNIVSESDTLGLVVTRTFDAENRLVRETDALGRQTRYEYTVDGLISRIIDTAGQITSLAYDSRGRLVERIEPDGVKTEFRLDGLGRVIEEHAEGLGVTRFSYDQQGNLTSVTDRLGATTEYDYDRNGNLISTTDADGIETVIGYDSLDRPTTTVLQNGASETLRYDAAGHQIEIEGFDGETILQQRDAAGNLIRQDFVDGTFETFTYSLSGQLLTATNANGTTTFEYDASGLLVSAVYPDQATLSYEYDLRGNRVAMVATIGNEISRRTEYTYDALNRLVSVHDPEGLETRYIYNTAGDLETIRLPNGIVEEYSYDEKHRLIRIESRSPGDELLTRLSYSRDRWGSITAVEREDGTRSSYEYDAQQRLTAEVHLDSNGQMLSEKEFDYTLAGQRSSSTIAGVLNAYQYDSLGRLIESGLTTHVHDQAGRLTSKDGPDGRTEYRYDAEGQLIGVTSDNESYQFEYDAIGNRIATTRNGVTQRHLIDLQDLSGVSQIVLNYGVDSSISDEFVFGLGRVSRRSDDALRTYHFGADGNLSGVTNEEGVIVNRSIVGAFGDLVHSIGDGTTEYAFAGETNISGTGLVDLRARFYQQDTGTFLSRDPYFGDLQNPVSLLRYQYGDGNPVNNSDPTGLLTLSETQVTVGVQALIGGLVSGVSSYLGGASAKQVVFDTFIGAAFGAIGGAFGNTLSTAFAESKLFVEFAKNPVVLKFSKRLVYAIPATGLGLTEDLTKGFGNGSYRNDGFFETVAFNTAANLMFNVLVGPTSINTQQFTRRVAARTGGKLPGTGLAMYQIISRAAREEGSTITEEALRFGVNEITKNEERFLQLLFDLSKFLYGYYVDEVEGNHT
ncbi:MAG: RHS repeat-associated core domain-containing protein, partial [Planctomycetota bacterium]